MFRVNSSLPSILVQNLGQSSLSAGRAIERLSSGLRINRSVDDPAGLLTSERLRSLVAGLQQANRNADTAVSLTQTADSALENVGDVIIRLKELATEAADSTVSSSSLSAIQDEADALLSEIDRIAAQTSFAGQSLLAANTDFTFFVGDGTGGSSDLIQLQLPDSSANQFLNGLTSANLATTGNSNAIASIELGVTSVALQRSNVGATQSQLERASTEIGTRIVALQGAQSVIRDADLALESSNLIRARLLTQTGVFGVAQLNLLNQSVLSLFNVGQAS